MKEYKLQEEELLASFRPDPSQNRQPPPNQNPQQFSQGYQLQYQNYPPNTMNINPQQPYQNPQPHPYAHLGPHRVSQHISANQQGPLPRSNSPNILISYNQMQRGVSPQQGSIVTQVYKPLNQQGYEVTVPNLPQQKPISQGPGPQQIVMQGQAVPQQQIVIQQGQPVPQQISQQQYQQIQANYGQQQVISEGQQVIIPQNQVIIQGRPNNVYVPQPLPQQQAQVAPQPQQIIHGQQQVIQGQQIQGQQQVQQIIQGQQQVIQGQQVQQGQQVIQGQQLIQGQQVIQGQSYAHHPQAHPHHYVHVPQGQPHYIPPQPQQIPPNQVIPAQGQVLQQVPANYQYPPRAMTASQQQQYLLYQQQMQEQHPQGQEYPDPAYYQQQGNENYQQQQGEGFEYPPQYYEQLAEQAKLWQDRFFYLFDKYQIFFEKYEGVTKEAIFLTQQFLNVDNEEEWLALKNKYDQLADRMNEAKNENALILQEMQDNVEHNQKVQDGNEIKEEAGRVWEHRYHELLEQYESLSHHYAELQSNSIAQNDMDDNDRFAMMNEKYARLEAEYNHVVQQFQNTPNSMQSRQEHQDLLKYTQQLQGYIQQLQNQNNNLVKGLKTSVEGSKMLDQGQITQKIAEKENQIQNLTQMVVSLQERLKQNSEVRPKSNISKDLHTSQLENQLQEMSHYCSEIEQKLSMKEYEINGLRDKVGFLEEELHMKNQELNSNSKMMQEKLLKIQTEIINRNTQNVMVSAPQPQYQQFRLDEDFEKRIAEYQKIIQSKNNEIRNLEDRIYQSQSEVRKINFQKTTHLRQWQEKLDQLEDDHRKKLNEKDCKIRQLQSSLSQLDAENQKRALEKDSAVKMFQSEMSKFKSQIDTRLIEKDMMIKNLKDTASRMENQIKQRNNEISRIRSPNLTPMMRSPNQSFAVENIRYQEEMKLLTDQLQRRNDEVAKLKKEREARNKQYKELQVQYEKLQEENNKRRIEVNNLRRQNTTIENFQLEVENLRVTINKRNTEINELKNQLFQVDKIKMDLDNRNREVEKLSEISRMKAKEIEHLNERNYELEEKIRQKEFKLNTFSKNEAPVNRNNQEEIMRLQEELRKREIELNKYKMENEDLSRTLKREKDELELFKQKYPVKLRQTEEELTELKVKSATLEKKIVTFQAKNRELEELNKNLRSTSIEESKSQNNRIKEYYTKFIERQEDEIKHLKERVRTYQLKVHENEQQIDQLSSRLKKYQTFKGEYSRKIKSLSEKLEYKDEEMKSIKGKENGEIIVLRKKEERLLEIQAQSKSKDSQIKELQRKIQALKGNLKTIKKQYDDYKHNTIEKMEISTHKEMENLNKQIADYESKMVFQNHNFDFKLKDKKANQIFERRVIYQLKEENQFLRRELQGKGINISIEKLKINRMQQEALMKSKHLIQKDEHSFSEEINFYKEKNKELEERVNSHIATNKNLKERLEYLLEENGKYEELDKLKLRLIELENKEKEYQEKMSRLLEENKSIRKENSNLNISTSYSQQSQQKLQEMSRKINQLTLERNSLQQELTVLRIQQDNIENQYKELEKALVKANNQCNILKSEIQRLKQTKTSNDGKKGNTQELQRQINQLTIELSNKTQQLERITFEFDNLQNHINDLQTELKSAKDQLQSSGQNFEEVQHWKSNVRTLQNQVALMRETIQQLENECQYYKSQSGQGNVRQQAFYFIELLRNNSIELESLASQVGLESERMALLVQRIGENSRRSLESCQYLHEILS